MMANLIDALYPYTKWKYVLIGMTLCVFINVVAFPWAGKIMKTYAPEAAGPIDLKFSYSPDEVYQMIESYSDAGRSLYIKSTIGIDLLYPIIYTLTTILILLMPLKKAFPKQQRFHRWALLPMVTFFADIFENTGIVTMLNQYPIRLDTIATITSLCSSIKWSFAGISLIFMIFLIIKVLFLKKKYEE